MKRAFDTTTAALEPAAQIELSLARDDVSFDALCADPRWPALGARIRAAKVRPRGRA
jgi:hypothetical protein